MCELCQAVFKHVGGVLTPVVDPVLAPRGALAPEHSLSSPPPPPRAAEAPTSARTGQPVVLYIPAAPPRRGHGGTIAAAILGAGLALATVAVVLKLAAKPQPSPPSAAVRAVPEKQVVYVSVPAAAPSLSSQEPTVLEPAAPAAAHAAPEPARVDESPSKRPEQIIVPYQGQDARTQRILVPITVNHSTTVVMALDTGAPGTLISLQLADHLGILRSDEGKLLTSASGIGGSAPALQVVLDSLTLGSAVEEFVPATVTDALGGSFEGLLGMDFITTFNLKIDAAQRVLVLTKPESNVRTPGGHGEGWWRRQFQRFSSLKKGWEGYRELVNRRISESQFSEGPSMEKLRRVRDLAESQVQEAGKLHSRLERHASNHSVPREWR